MNTGSILLRQGFAVEVWIDKRKPLERRADVSIQHGLIADGQIEPCIAEHGVKVLSHSRVFLSKRQRTKNEIEIKAQNSKKEEIRPVKKTRKTKVEKNSVLTRWHDEQTREIQGSTQEKDELCGWRRVKKGENKTEIVRKRDFFRGEHTEIF